MGFEFLEIFLSFSIFLFPFPFEFPLKIQGLIPKKEGGKLSASPLGPFALGP